MDDIRNHNNHNTKFSFHSGDWLLRFLYRTLSVAIDGVAGLQEIELNDKKMHNVDLTSLVTGEIF